MRMLVDATQVWFILFLSTHSHSLPEPRNVVELDIDEQSPDEDDRLALQFLKRSNDIPPHDRDDHGDDSGIKIYLIIFYMFTFSIRASASRFQSRLVFIKTKNNLTMTC